MVSQDVPQLQLAAAAAEALRAFNNWLGERRQAQEGQRHLDDVSPADGGRAPPGTPAALRARRAPGRRTKLRNGKEMKTLRAHGFNQRPRFEQVVGYLERNEPLPWTSRTARPPRSSQATSTWTILCSPARTPTPCPCSTRLCRQFPRKASALPQRPRTRTWRGCAKEETASARTTLQETRRPARWPATGSTADGAQAAADLVGAGAAGVAAAQAFRSQLPQGGVRPPKCIAPPRAAAAAASADHRPAQ